MVKDQQVRRLFTLLQTENSQAVAAAQAGMDVQTARKYQRLGRLPSEVKIAHHWRTREDPFTGVWAEVAAGVGRQPRPGSQDPVSRCCSGSIPGDSRMARCGRFSGGSRPWRATAGPAQEVFFAQVHNRDGCARRTSRTWRTWGSPSPVSRSIT